VTGTGIDRSIALVRAFRLEQAQPDVFYGALATDTARMIDRLHPVRGARVLDAGSGPRQFAETFVGAGATYVGLDRDPDALDPIADPRAQALCGDACALPLRDGSVDIAYSSNVFEHVREPERLADELVRVVRPGGLVVVSYTNWLSPWGGHETSPFHYLGGQRAIRRYARAYGRQPKNRVDVNLFRTSVSQGLRWARSRSDAELLEAKPRYYPPWVSWITQVPVVREFVTWNLWLALRKR